MRTCTIGSIRRNYIAKDDASSPTVSTDSVLITNVIEARQKRDIITSDIPNAFALTEIPKTTKGERGIMKIKCILAKILCKIAPNAYLPFITYDNNCHTIYLRMIKALYGMLVSALLYYKKFRADLEKIGFKVHPYDQCMANKIKSRGP